MTLCADNPSFETDLRNRIALDATDGPLARGHGAKYTGHQADLAKTRAPKDLLLKTKCPIFLNDGNYH